MQASFGLSDRVFLCSRFFMACFVGECSGKGIPETHYGLLHETGRGTGNYDPETSSGMELHKVTMGPVWKRAE